MAIAVAIATSAASAASAAAAAAAAAASASSTIARATKATVRATPKHLFMAWHSCTLAVRRSMHVSCGAYAS